MKKQEVWIISGWGLNVRRREKLREDEHFVYARIHGQKGRGSRYLKQMCFDYSHEAFIAAAFMLEGVALANREEAARCKHGKV